MTNEERGNAIEKRRAAQDRLSVRQLARMAKMSRATVDRAIAGHSTPDTYNQLERTLDKIEAGELRMIPAVEVARAERQPTVDVFEFKGEHVTVVAHISADSPEELREKVAAFLAGAQQADDAAGLDQG